MPAARGNPTLATEGLIIREYNGVGEADRFVTVLTKDRGVVRAAARGARRIKSRSGSATGLLCYSRFRLIAGRDTYVVEDAQPIEVFFSLRQDIEKTALAQYFCELTYALCPADEPAPDALRLILGGLKHLADGTRPAPLIKAVIEWRLLSQAGYMPDLNGCAVCGMHTDEMYLSPVGGRLFCSQHLPPNGCRLTAGALQAILHTVGCPVEKCFGFSLADASLAAFGDTAEHFLKAQLERSFKTLDFYHEVSRFGTPL